MTVATSTLHPAMAAFGGIGAPEVIIIVLVVLLLFGGRKLPEVARGTGRALRIFKAETKGLIDDDDEDDLDRPSGRQQSQQQITPGPAQQPRQTDTSAGNTGATSPEDGTTRPTDPMPPTQS